MAESPDVHRVADHLADAFVGHRLSRVFFGATKLKIWEKRLQSARVEGVRVRGRALLLRLKPGLFLYSRVRPSGRWYIGSESAAPQWRRRIDVELHAGESAVFLYHTSDVAVLTADELERHPFLSTLGPDVLDPSLEDSQIYERLLARQFGRRQLSSLLLDQSFVAGLGASLRSEVLFFSRLDPSKRLGMCDETERMRLLFALKEIPRRSYLTGRTVDPRWKMPPDLKYAVYKRAGRACYVCRTKIRKRQSSGQLLFWCSQCQSRDFISSDSTGPRRKR